MNLTKLFVVITGMLFVIVVWNLVLPISGAKNQDFLNYLKDVFSSSYRKDPYLQQYVNAPIVAPIKTDLENLLAPQDYKFEKYALGPRLQSSDTTHYVTMTFYVEYGQHQDLPSLLDLLHQYNITKSVFFLDSVYAKDHYFVIQRIQNAGYDVHEWKKIGEYDENYLPSVFSNVTLSGHDVLNDTKRDKTAAAFFNMAVHYYNSSIVAFTPKIMGHPLLLDELVQQNGKDLTFVDSNKTSNAFVQNFTSYQNDDVEDPIMDYLGLSSAQGMTISHGMWTMDLLAAAYPNVVKYIPEKNAYVIEKRLVIDKGTILHIANTTVLLESAGQDPPTGLDISGRVQIDNSTITSWVPDTNSYDLNAYHPRPNILVNAGVLNIDKSSLTHLGYSIGGISDTRYASAAVAYYHTENGTISNSVLAHNYYGFYSAYATHLKILHDEVFDNVGYGLDPHTATVNMLVDSNHIYDNGKQGVICSLHCANITITNNVVEHNGDGIGLHWLTNSSLVKDNLVRYNGQYGIFVQKISFDNLIINNTVLANKFGIGLIDSVSGNTVTGNTLIDNIVENIRIGNDSASNTLENNYVLSPNDPGISSKTKSMIAEDP